MRKLLLVSIAVILALGYRELLAAFNVSLTIWPTPKVLTWTFGSRLVAARVWLYTWHLIAVVMAAIPIALVACRAYGKQVLPWAAGIALAAVLPDAIQSAAATWELALSPLMRAMFVIDTLEVAFALPLIAMLMNRAATAGWIIGLHAAGALALGFVLMGNFGGNALSAMGTSFVLYLFLMPLAVVVAFLWIRRVRPSEAH